MLSVLPVILSLGMGSVSVESLKAPVEITLDARGVPTVTASNMDDGYRGEGYIHARDRFFQMDMMRRYAAGEMAALAGSLVLEIDKQVRVYRGRPTCEAIFESLSSGEQAILRAYTEGVNAGLASLESVPPEYDILHTTPAPWTPVDSLLVNFSMTMTLTQSSRVELSRWAIHRLGSPEWVDFLLTAADPRDRPMIQAPDGPEDLPPLPKPVKRGDVGLTRRARLLGSHLVPTTGRWPVVEQRTVVRCWPTIRT